MFITLNFSLVLFIFVSFYSIFVFLKVGFILNFLRNIYIYLYYIYCAYKFKTLFEFVSKSYNKKKHYDEFKDMQFFCGFQYFEIWFYNSKTHKTRNNASIRLGSAGRSKSNMHVCTIVFYKTHLFSDSVSGTLNKIRA